MLATLQPHPESPPSPITRLQVQVERTGGALTMAFTASGDISCLRLPAPASGRADNLWRHTCFESFVGAGGQNSYVELNLSPSGRWAAYAFDGYRAGMRDADLSEPRSNVEVAADRLMLHTEADLSAIMPADQAWSLGLAAVLEHTDGARSYWALTHPAGAPDFHHPDGFALTLPPQVT